MKLFGNKNITSSSCIIIITSIVPVVVVLGSIFCFRYDYLIHNKTKIQNTDRNSVMHLCN